MRLSWPLSAAIGVSGSAAAAISSDADLDLDAAELHALVVLELARDREEGARREGRDRLGEREGRGVLLGPVLRRGRVAGLTSWTAPVSSRRMTNCTFF